MDTPREIELKLVCAPADFKSLMAHPRLAGGVSRRAVNLKSVYFDAPDRRLEQAGLTLRVRTSRGRYVQTVKAVGDGLFDRPEWERKVAGPGPDPLAIAETPAGELLGPEPEVAPVFAVEVRRKIFLVEEGGSTIEVAFDEGRIAGPDARTDTISEVELELKSGAARDLFVLARELADAVPLKVGVLSKAERGYALLSEAKNGPVKAAAVKLDRSMSAADAFRAIAHACIKQAMLNEAPLSGGSAPEALHQLRVGVRRLRSAVSLFGDLVQDAEGAALNAELKRVVEPFGAARNLDVFLAETLPAERERRPDEAGLLNLEKQFEAKRPASHAVVRETLESEAWRRLVLDLVAWINAGPWLSPADETARARLDQPARDFAAAALDHRLKQVKKRGRNLSKLEPEARHKVRIAAKKLRYGAEFFGSLFPSEKKAERRLVFVKALKRMQSRLGKLNDADAGQKLLSAAAETELDGASSLFAAGMASADLEVGHEALIEAAAAAHAELIKARPFWR